MGNFSKVFFGLAAFLAVIIVTGGFCIAKGKEPIPFKNDTTFLTKNVVMYADGDTLKLVTKKLTQIVIKNGVMTADGNILTNGMAMRTKSKITVSWVNKNGWKVVFTGNNPPKTKEEKLAAKLKR